ncbi:unnamed protein product [Linum trigynum]|uniref:RNase H type-1 domain-containing protein n=1 Tax=Linum trigynum TaxID=586398 RepID=A0AAV2FHZ8_9ROSI
MRQFNQQYQEWINLPGDRPHPRPPASSSSPLGTTNAGSFICQWDGATRRGSHSAGGMVIRSSAGLVVGARGVQFGIIDDPLVVEMLTLRDAIHWCTEEGLTDVRFEGDAQVIVEKLTSSEVRDSRIGALLEEVLHCLSNQQGFSVQFVGRHNNRVAHLVARNTLLLYPSASRFFDFVAWLNSRM